MKTPWNYMPLKWMFGAISRLPFWALYGLSDVLFVVIYYIVRYRRKVALVNIEASFPDKSHGEHCRICRKFFRNFADYFFETIKLNHVADESIKRRMEFCGMEIVDRLFDQGKSIVAYFSHCGNWEWVPSITLWSSHRPSDTLVYAQVYRPLSNAWFDAYFLHLRSRFGSVSFEKRMVLRDLLVLKRDGKQSITGFMSDQKPSKGDVTHVVKFLNHPTAMITGTETIARRLGMAAIYFDMEKTSRGHYRLTVRLIAEDASLLEPMALTDSYASMLQTTIERNPPIWLWTHKRWKYPVEYPVESNDNKSDSRQ